MYRFLKHLNIYLIAAVAGFVFGRYVMPFLAIDLLGDYMPWRQSFAHMLAFGHYAFIRPMLIWGAAMGAGLIGFLPLRCGRVLRGAILTLPLTAPVLYGVLYLILAFRVTA